MPRFQLRAVLALVLALAAAGDALAQATIGRSFPASNRNNSGFWPPDTCGAVGPGHFVELINGRYAVYRKSDGFLLLSQSLDMFWVSAGVVPINYSFDPRILYDAVSQRWFALAVDNARFANRFLLAVSRTSNPLNGWDGFAIDSDADDQQWADFPLLGISGGTVVITATMFNIGGSGASVTIVVVPKDDLLLPTPTVANLTRYENVSAADTGYTLQPVVNLDNSAGPHSLFSAYNTPAGFLKRSQITGTPASPQLSISGGFITVPAVGGPPTAPQPPMPTQKANIHSGDDRFSGSVILRNGSLWATQGVNVGGRAAVRWFRINASTLAIQAQGTISHPQLSFYYPSIAVNGFGDVVIGFSGSGPTQPVSAYAVVGQTVGSTTTFGEPMLLRAGVDDYQTIDGAGRNRWGDYSATTVDPVDPRRFWTIQEYVMADDVWGTWVTEIIIGSCPVIDAQPAPVSVASGQPAVFTVAASGTPAPSYRWRLDGSDLSDGPGVSGATTPTLTIDPARLANRGAYSVVVTNSCGSAPSNAAALSVSCPPDANGDEVLNSGDITAFLGVWLASLQQGTLQGDFNGDGLVNSGDISAFLTSWLAYVGPGC